MRDCDLADSPLASCPPQEPHCDSLRDVLAEPFAQFRGRLPRDHAAFRVTALELLDLGLAASESAGVAVSGAVAPADTVALLARVLQYMSRDTDRHYALRAVCYLRLLGHEGRSFEAIGAQFGVGRAAVQIIYRQLQRRHPQLRSRGDKSDRAREDCKRRRTGARKLHEPWPLASLWRNPLPIAA
ncbi:MAG: hypothetical protein ABMA13_20140 [Chthoniobacteraceae bacterium]